jgi:transposase
MKKVRFLGLDVHAETIAVAVAESDGGVRCWGIIPNREESVRKLVKHPSAAASADSTYKTNFQSPLLGV